MSSAAFDPCPSRHGGPCNIIAALSTFREEEDVHTLLCRLLAQHEELRLLDPEVEQQIPPLPQQAEVHGLLQHEKMYTRKTTFLWCSCFLPLR